jgi:hypothetical protein
LREPGLPFSQIVPPIDILRDEMRLKTVQPTPVNRRDRNSG